MQAPDQKTIDNLQTSCQLMAHLAGQYRVDIRNLKAMSLDWLGCCMKDWYKGAEDFLDQFIDRLLFYDTDPEYDLGSVAGAESIDDILSRAEDLVSGALEQFVQYRKTSWDTRADYTTDIYEHAADTMEKQLMAIEAERALIKKLGEAAYIAARLDDDAD